MTAKVYVISLGVWQRFFPTNVRGGVVEMTRIEKNIMNIWLCMYLYLNYVFVQ